MLKDIFFVIITSIIAMTVLFIIARIMGSKQMSQMTTFDYITGITIGSAAAELATDIENFVRPLTAIIIIGATAVLYTIWERKSKAARRLADDFPVLLLHDGKLIRDNFTQANINLGDFLCLCREKGYFDITEIKTALLEQNGQLSILPKSYARPVTPSDMSLSPTPPDIKINVIMDGEIIAGNLATAGLDEKALTAMLKAQGFKKPEEVFLATCDSAKNLTVYAMNSGKIRADWFE